MSIVFLLALGLMNIVNICRAAADQVVAPAGSKQHLLGRLFGAGWAAGMHRRWWLVIGALFAISIDTLGEATVYSTAADRTGVSQGALLCALVFTTGMPLTDGLNGWWVARLLSRSNAAAHTASRVMGLSVGAASLVMAADRCGRTGVLHRCAQCFDEWCEAFNKRQRPERGQAPLWPRVFNKSGSAPISGPTSRSLRKAQAWAAGAGHSNRGDQADVHPGV